MRFFIISFLILIAQSSLANGPSCEALFQVNKHSIQMNLAASAGLHYSTHSDAGYTRKKVANQFVYIDSEGVPVASSAELARIQALNIPPGYHDVWISKDPLAHVQARALDDRDRSQ